METMLLDAFQNDELGDDAHITDTLFESLKSASTTPLFGPSRSKSTQLGTTMLLYNLKANFGMSNACFSTILRSMFTCLFEGETSSRAELYYNNIKDKTSHTLYSYLY
jgi:hypothetical protein